MDFLVSILEDFNSTSALMYDSLARELSHDKTDLALFSFNFLFFLSIVLIVRFLAPPFLNRIQKKIDNQSFWNFIFERKVFTTLAYAVPFISNYFFSGFYHIEFFSMIIEKLSSLMLTLLITISVNKILLSLNDYYRTTDVAANLHLTWLFQIFQILVAIVGLILIVSIVVNKSVFVLLSGVGALTAAVLFIFRETFLSILASFQIQMDHTLTRGDWIEMPNLKIAGSVENITLFVVKIRGSDNSMTYLPVKALVDQSYQNHKSVELFKAKRISHKISIRPDCVRILTKEELKKIIEEHEEDARLASFLSEEIGKAEETLNLSICRKYLIEVLKRDPFINSSHPIIIRYHDQDTTGIPMEIYAFSSKIDFEGYSMHKARIVETFLCLLKKLDILPN